jgi:hypothetical protein
VADGVAITAGSGTTVSTDDAGASGHVQRVKLAYSADGSATHVTADADGVLVNLGANNDVTVAGVSTAANQTTIIGHLDGVEGLLTTIDADTGTVAGAVSGTEMQVDVVAALPAGTNAIGKLAANSGVDIGDVDVTSVTPGTTASSLGKAEDAGHTTGDVGVMALGVRNDSLAAFGDNLDYAPIAVQAAGKVYIAGSYFEDSQHASTDAGVFVLGVRNDAGAATFGADGDYGPVATDANGRVGIADLGGSVTVDNAGTFAVQDSTAQASLSVIDDWDESDRAKVNIVAGQAGITAGAGAVGASTPRVTLASDDPAVVALQILDNAISGSEMQVDIVGALPAGTAAIGKLAANSGVDIGDVDVTSISAGDNVIGRVKLSDGTDVADILDLTNSNPLTVAIVDGSGSQITSFGGGTQYTEGDTDASITGTALLWEDGSDTLRAASAAKPLPVEVIAGATSGTEYTEGATDATITGQAILWEDAADTLVTVNASKPLPVSNAGLTELAAAIDTELQVDVVGALPAGTNAIGKLAANSGVDIGDVDVTSIIPGVGATNLGKTEDEPHGSGDTGVFILGVRNDSAATTMAGTNGDYSPISVDSVGRVFVRGMWNEDAQHVTGHEGVQMLGVRNNDSAATFTNADADYSPLAVAPTGAVITSGPVSHDTAAVGYPLQLGGVAVAHGADPTAVAAADATRWYFNRDGIPFVLGGHMNLISREYLATSAQTNVAMVDIAAGTKIVVTECEAVCDKANTVDVAVRIGFGASVPTAPSDGTTVAGMVLTHPGIAAGSGVVVGSGAGIVAIGGDGEDLRITHEVPTSGSVRVMVRYFLIES